MFEIFKKEAWPGTCEEAVEDDVMKTWIEMISDILCLKVLNFQALLIHIGFFLLCNYH